MKKYYQHKTNPLLGDSYSNSLDGLRAICILLTIFNHVHGNVPRWINGSVGVDIFFALSGFLITTLLEKDLIQKKKSILISFYIRRFFRIVPLYMLAVLASFFGAYFLSVLSHDNEKIKYAISSLPWLLTFNRDLCDASSCGLTYFGHGWTIGVEEKFYIFWPVLFLFAIKKSRLHVVFCVLLIIGAVLALFSNNMIRGYLGLSFGCLTAIWFEYIAGLPRRFVGLVSGFCIFLGYIISSCIDFSGNVLVSFGAAGLTVYLLTNSESVLSKILSLKPFVFVGKLTYGIYLFHVLILNVIESFLKRYKLTELEYGWFGVFLLGYAGSVFLSYVLYVVVERPAIKFGKKWSAS